MARACLSIFVAMRGKERVELGTGFNRSSVSTIPRRVLLCSSTSYAGSFNETLLAPRKMPHISSNTLLYTIGTSANLVRM